MKFIAIILLSLIIKPIVGEPFSFKEIQQVPIKNLKQPAFVKTSDGIELAYYSYIPKNPKAIVIFYHGAGLYGNAIHQWIAEELQEKSAIGTYVVDIRGHGNSGGERGDAPSIQQVWEDVSTVIKQAKTNYPNVPLYLAGHSSGAGLLLNYAAWPEHTTCVDGLILLAPYLGPNSGTLKVHQDPELQFAKKIRTWVFTIAGLTNGYLCAHIPAVYFNYPDYILQDQKMLTYYTYTMSAATTPYQPKAVFESIQIPTTMLIADEDEQFIAPAIAEYANFIPQSVPRYTEIIKDTKHLTLLLQAPTLIAQAIERQG